MTAFLVLAMPLDAAEARLEEQLQVAKHRRERRTELVGDRRHELLLDLDRA
jgi:hypothetical protein